MEWLITRAWVEVFLTPVTHGTIIALLAVALRRGVPARAIMPLIIGHLLKFIYSVLMLLLFLQVYDGRASGRGIPQLRLVVYLFTDWAGSIFIIMGWFVFASWLVRWFPFTLHPPPSTLNPEP